MKATQSLFRYLLTGGLLLLSTASYAVLYQPVALTSSDGEPVQSATVSLTIGGTTVTAVDNGPNDKDSRIGFFKIPVDDDSSGKKASLVITAGGKTTRKDITIGRDANIAINTGSSATGSGMGNGIVTVIVSHTDGKIDTKSSTSFGYSANGRNINSGQLALGLDYRLPLANIYNMFWGLQGHIYRTDNSYGLKKDLHPTPGLDTFLSVNQRWALMLYTGYVIASIQDAFKVSLIGGLRVDNTEIEGITNESGGGGNKESFKDFETSVTPTAGVEITGKKIKGTNSKWRAGIALEKLEAHSVNGISGLGNDYKFSTDSKWHAKTYVGLTY